jgi:hypothetical protein
MTALLRKNIWFQEGTWMELKETAMKKGLSPSEAVASAVEGWLKDETQGAQ